MPRSRRPIAVKNRTRLIELPSLSLVPDLRRKRHGASHERPAPATDRFSILIDQLSFGHKELPRPVDNPPGRSHFSCRDGAQQVQVERYRQDEYVIDQRVHREEARIVQALEIELTVDSIGCMEELAPYRDR